MNARHASLLAVAVALCAPPAVTAEYAAPAVGAPQGVQIAQAVGQRSLRNAEFGFRLAHPADWVVGEATEPTVKTVLYSPPGPNPASCQVILRDVDEYWGLTQPQLDWGMNNHPTFNEHMAEGLPAARYTNVEVRDLLPTKIGNLPARVSMIAATDTKVQQPTVMMMFLVRTPPGRVWHVTCATTGADLKAADAAFNARRIDFLRLFSTFYWGN